MMNKVCELETMGNGLESLIQRFFNMDITSFSDTGAWICQMADANILVAMLIAVGLPFVEAFIPSLPYTAFVIFNVSLLGGFLGFFLSLIGTVSGSFLLFLFIRFLLQKPMLRFLEKHNQLGFYQKIEQGIERHGMLYIFILYGVLGLILPSSLCTISLALTAFSKRKFFIGLLLGKAMVTGILALFGSSVTKVFTNPILVVVMLGSIVGIYFLTKYIEKRFNLHKDSM